MPRTASAANIRDRFSDDLSQLESFFNRASAALAGRPNEQSDVSQLSLSVFTSAAVAFETFWSDLFVALVNRRPQKFQAYLVQKTERQIAEHIDEPLRTLVAISPPARLTVGEASAFLDAQGRNVTFPDAKALSDKAKKWLDPTFASPIRRLANTEGEMYEAVRALRNYAAHRSGDSRAIFNAATAKLDPGPYVALHRGTRTTRDAGAYLKAYVDTPAGSVRRVIVYTGWMRTAATGLTVD